MIAYAGQGSFKGKKVAISGSGNVAQYAAIKVIELGGTVLSLSDSQGSLFAPEGSSFSPEDVENIAALKLKRQSLTAILERRAQVQVYCWCAPLDSRESRCRFYHVRPRTKCRKRKRKP